MQALKLKLNNLINEFINLNQKKKENWKQISRRINKIYNNNSNSNNNNKIDCYYRVSISFYFVGREANYWDENEPFLLFSSFFPLSKLKEVMLLSFDKWQTIEHFYSSQKVHICREWNLYFFRILKVYSFLR